MSKTFYISASADVDTFLQATMTEEDYRNATAQEIIEICEQAMEQKLRQQLHNLKVEVSVSLNPPQQLSEGVPQLSLIPSEQI